MSKLARQAAQDIHDDISTFKSEADIGVRRLAEGNIAAATGIMKRLADHCESMRRHADVLLAEIPVE